MTIRVGINGFGRIGRNVLRALCESGRVDVDVVAINDIGSPESLMHLLRYDTTHGAFSEKVDWQDGVLLVADRRIALTHFSSPENVEWAQYGVDIVLECTGCFRAYDQASRHLVAGAPKVILGAVPFDHADAIVVIGVNEQQLTGDEKIVSAASCTTQCLAPLLNVMNNAFGVDSVLMTEIHAMTSDQVLLDHTHRDLRRARAGAHNIIPTTSSSIAAVQKVLPSMAGKVDGYSVRVPTLNVAALDLALVVQQQATVDDINALFESEALKSSGLMAVNNTLLVSSDFNHRTESAVVDLTETRVIGKHVKLLAWYDNEWGYACRLLDLAARM